MASNKFLIESIDTINEIEKLWDYVNNILETESNIFKLKMNSILNIDNIHKILDYIQYYYNNDIKLIEFLETTVKLPTELKEDILKYLIKEGFKDFLWYSEISNVNVEKIVIELIKEGFIEFYPLIKNKKGIKKEISKDELIQSAYELKSNFNKLSLHEKIIFLLSNDWDAILEELYNKEDALSIKEILKLSKNEKKIFEKTKNNSYYIEYTELIYDIKEDINRKNFRIKKELSFSPAFSTTDNQKDLENSLLEIELLHNGTNSFNITFISISGKVSTHYLEPLNIQSNINQNIYFDYNLFKNEILKENKIHKKNLSNSFDYTIIISQEIGTKAPTPINIGSGKNIDVSYKKAA